MKNKSIKDDRKSIELQAIYTFAEDEISGLHTNLHKTILNNLRIILLFECIWTKLENDGYVKSVINCKRVDELYLLK